MDSEDRGGCLGCPHRTREGYSPKERNSQDTMNDNLHSLVGSSKVRGRVQPHLSKEARLLSQRGRDTSPLSGSAGATSPGQNTAP